MIKIVGHKGACGYAPENTLKSFQTAIEIGCDRAELDVRFSKDHELMVIHDEEVSRVSDGHGLVRDLTLEELKKMHCKDQTTFATLQEVMDLCKNKIPLQIELKEKGTPQAVNTLIQKNHMEDECVITSFDVSLLQEMKQLNPKIRVGLLFQDFSDTIWHYTKQIPLDFIGPAYSAVTADLVAHAHSMGMLVYAYHVNTKEIGERLIDLQVDEIGTDFPKLFM